MIDSDDDFTELCSKLLKRVKKNKPSEGPTVPKASSVARSKLKKPKPLGVKNQAYNDSDKEPEQNITAAGGPHKSSDNTDKNCASLTLLSNGHNHNGNRGAEIQEGTAGRTDQPSIKHLILERMQQFKRADPRRMKLNSTDDQETGESPVMDGALQSDGALAMALHMDLNKQPDSLEDEGLFFCQICQKDLTAMSSALREQHVNRCLDQGEGEGPSPVGHQVPSCPLCGKPFSTEKSRASHLKRCATKLEVSAQTLLQAVQRQAAETGTEIPLQAARVKRKGSGKQKEPPKKRKTTKTGSETQDLLVAMALSRSMQEENGAPNTATVQPSHEIPPPEKKSRRKQKDKPTPLLLVQDPEEAAQKLQKRMSMLLSEEPEENYIVPLPHSHFWTLTEEERAAWRIQGGKKCVLWDISNLMESRDVISYYTAELNPPITPWRQPSNKRLSSKPHVATPSLPTDACHGVTPTLLDRGPHTDVPALSAAGTTCHTSAGQDHSPSTPCQDRHQPTNSQKDQQALLDLAELAEEGMVLTQWNAGDRTDRESPDVITASGFIPSQEEESSDPSLRTHTKSPYIALAADFMEMVNNPHLSDAQLQTDCGEVLNVHMFVLYARCPLLVEAVHSEGFWVDEAGTGRIRRLLLNDVSTEAALCFIRFLYCANSAFPSHCLPHVCELARRFDVKSLIETCERLVCEPKNSEPLVTTGEEDEDGGEREENFQELLKSMWIGDGEDLFADQEAEDLGEEKEKVDDGNVGDVELEEIYEFVATQRRTAEQRDSEYDSCSEQEAGRKEKRSESNSPPLKSQVVEGRQQTTGAENQNSTDWHVQTYAVNATPHKEYSSNALKSSPLEKPPTYSDSPVGVPVASMAWLNDRQSPSGFVGPVRSLSGSVGPIRSASDSVGPVRSLSGSVGPVRSPSGSVALMRSPSGSVAPVRSPANPVAPIRSSASPVARVKSPSRSVPPVKSSHPSLPAVTPARRLFVDDPSSTSTLEALTVPVVSTISLICPDKEDPGVDLFDQRSPPPLDDSYDRMFSETCGEYGEPSGICNSRSHSNPNTPQNQKPLLTSSPFTIPCSGLPELGSSPNKQGRRLSFLNGSSQSGHEHMWSPNSSLKNSQHSVTIKNLSTKASPVPKAMSPEEDIILILSSDEEMEHSTQPVAQPIKEEDNRSDSFQGLKESPVSFARRKSRDRLSHLEMSSGSEISWLIPATPMPQPKDSRVTSHLSQSSPKSKVVSSEDASPVSPHSFVSPTQKSSPKTSLIMNESLCSSITEKPDEVGASLSSKCISSPPTSIASSTVFEVEDSEDEVPVAEPQADISGCSFQMDYEPPIPMDDDLWSNMQETPTKPDSPVGCTTPLNTNETLTEASVTPCSNPPGNKNTELASTEETPCTTASQSSLLSYLNSKVWDEWEEEPEMPAVLPLSQRLNKVPALQKELRTPVSIVRKRELAPKVPITPLPGYSDMDTPVLKKELNKFGVRPLPKKQMVLKLKEIFSYTHQVMSSDSEDDVPSSQPCPISHRKVDQTERLPGPRKRKPPATAKTSSLSQPQPGKKKSSVCTAPESDTGDDQPLTASQESTTSSVAMSDISSTSHGSNSNEFETAFADEEDDEPVTASQAANKEALTTEAVRRFIEERPELHKRILLYQPLELAALHAELKQNGIRMAAGKLLDFLDTNCVTFTTAAARKEKKSRRKRKAGKRY